VSLKVDLELLSELAVARPDWYLVLLGPVSPDSRQSMERLRARSNVSWFGPVSYERLPAYVAHFDVGLIPYRSNKYTASCFPLKLYEYMASGLPVVVSGLPSLPDLRPDVVSATGVEEMIDAIQSQLERCTAADVERRRRLAAQHTWSHRAEQLLTITEGVIRGGSDAR
jgi:glycosyltransferase involved in cell wall biosynthesis